MCELDLKSEEETVRLRLSFLEPEELKDFLIGFNAGYSEREGN